MKGATYEAADGIGWRLKAGNGKPIAESGDSYTDERGAADAFTRLFPSYPLTLLDGTVVTGGGEPVAEQPALVGQGLGPTDPSHPLYSPLTIDGNK